jgi:RNA polymerase sigma-70 factor (ECF subfamily)
MRIVQKSYESWSDEELMQALSKGNHSAFTELYERYSKPLFHYFLRLLWRDQTLAEDMVHDLFAKIIKKPELFDVTRSFRTWIYVVATNMCKNEYRKKEVRRGVSNGLDNYYTLYDSNENVLNKVQDSQFKEAFIVGLNALDAKHKEVFTLRHMDGLSMKEIADVLEISEGTVKSRLFYATKYLAAGLTAFSPVIK